MNEILKDSAYFGFFLTLFAYWAGVKIKNRWKMALLNPLLIALILVIGVLVAFRIDYDTFNAGAQYISYLLTPATVCLALPLYRQIRVLKEHWAAVVTGLVSGCVTSLGLAVLFAELLKVDPVIARSLLPKSITTAIAMGVTEELGGISAVTVAVVILTGVAGAVIATGVFKLFKIKDPVAQGLALGASAHAIGTSKALELGELQGAMSSLAIVATGILTVILAPVVAGMAF